MLLMFMVFHYLENHLKLKANLDKTIGYWLVRTSISVRNAVYQNWSFRKRAITSLQFSRNSFATSVQTKAKSSTLENNKFVARVKNNFMEVYKSFTSLGKKCSCVISNRTSPESFHSQKLFKRKLKTNSNCILGTGGNK